MISRAPRRRLRGRQSKQLLLNRHRGRLVCAYCNKSVPPELARADHAIPLIRGGTDKMDNIVAACGLCDSLKGPLTADEFLAVRKDHAARKELIREILREVRENPPQRLASNRRRSR